MNPMRLLVIILIASTAYAEGMHARFTAGTTIFADDGPVSETTLGGSVRFYFSKRWSVEPEFLYAWKESDRNYFLWGNVAFDFVRRDRRVVPYWYISPGLVVHTQKSIDFNSSEASIATGFGTRIHLSDRVFIAPAVPDRCCGRGVCRVHRQHRVHLQQISLWATFEQFWGADRRNLLALRMCEWRTRTRCDCEV